MKTQLVPVCLHVDAADTGDDHKRGAEQRAPAGGIAAAKANALLQQKNPGVTSELKGVPNMAIFSFDMPENTGPDGVTREFLEEQALARGTTPERLTNVVLANYFGFKPPLDAESVAWDEAAKKMGFGEPDLERAKANMTALLSGSSTNK